MEPPNTRKSVTDFTRTPASGILNRARWIGAVAVILAVSAFVSWGPSLFIPPSDFSHDPLMFVLRVANLALQQYTPNMRAVVPALGALFMGISALQLVAGCMALFGRVEALSALRGIAYVKVGCFAAAVLLLGLALFSHVDPRNQPWNLAAATWVASFAFIGAYLLIIRAINRVLGDPLDPGFAADDDALDEEAE
jgi:hypothetical protein